MKSINLSETLKFFFRKKHEINLFQFEIGLKLYFLWCLRSRVIFFIFENGHLKIYYTLLYPGKSREIRYLMKYIRIFEFLEGFKLSIFALDCVINPNPLSPSPAQLTSSDQALFRKKK